MVDEARAAADSIPSGGGSVPGCADQPAFSLFYRADPPLPVLISVPHAGRSYPATLVARMRHPAAASLRLEDRYVDLVAQAVARATGAALLVAHAPRAMIDLNRAPEDVDWEMVAGGAPAGAMAFSAGRRARSGLGLVPRRLSGMGEVWRRRLSASELAERVEHVHRPYHAALAERLESLRDRWGGALLLDLHSMPPLGAKRGADPAPDFVIGDRFGASCGSGLAALACDHLAAAGHTVAHNRPYAGGYVLDRHGAPARGVHAVQVEVCRSTYLDSHLREPDAGLAGVAAALAGLVQRLAAELADQHRLPQAAE
ncbi:MAG: hypothetical protein RLZZ08_1600 [Pseudomonadota bacterium]|jgi:N-formylglutamate amidohydrolase